MLHVYNYRLNTGYMSLWQVYIDITDTLSLPVALPQRILIFVYHLPCTWLDLVQLHTQQNMNIKAVQHNNNVSVLDVT